MNDGEHDAGSMVELTQATETIMAVVRAFGRAIEAQEWDDACRMWDVLLTMDEIRTSAEYAAVGTWLKRQKWFAEVQPVGTH